MLQNCTVLLLLCELTRSAIMWSKTPTKNASKTMSTSFANPSHTEGLIRMDGNFEMIFFLELVGKKLV